MTWRLGIDLGTNSLGWAALSLAREGEDFVPDGLMDSGVRIFSDGRNPKDKQSNAAKRREPRGARKNRDRYIRRRSRLMRELVEFSLMPQDPDKRKKLEGGKGVALVDSDPWILRVRALGEEITPYQLGRAIFHLHQRRGFKSNRKTDRADDKESGKVFDATMRTRQRLAAQGARTLGELFGRSRLEAVKYNETAPKGSRLAQPLARVRKSGEGAKWQYDYYPTREMILDEFDQIWDAQKLYCPDILSDAARERLRNTIEWQHPLKSPPVGKCTFIAELQLMGYGGDGSGSDEDIEKRKELERAPKALPSSQRARIFQEVNALRVGALVDTKIPLTLEQRNLVAESLLHPTNQKATRTFNQIRKILGLGAYDNFNTESAKRTGLVGDETAARLMQKDRWGESWFELDLAIQDEIVTRLINEEQEEELVAYLGNVHGLDKERALRVADCPLPDGYGNLSKLALDRILPALEDDVIVYSDAVIAAGFSSHSQFGTGEVFDEALPYYGYVLERSVAFGTGDPSDMPEKHYGKVANPTVHVALNQIRAVINDLMKRFGPPEQIVLELARGLPLSARGKSDLEKTQRENQQANERRSALLIEEFKQPDNYNNRMRLRLYEELEALGKRCVYSGEQIGVHNLFSPEVEIEHILPFSRTFDDGFSNKTLSMRRANRDKGNQTPFEAFGHSPDDYDWEEISKRAGKLHDSKAWRFAPDAMERYENEERDFLARQLTDTQYISRLAKAYVAAIYGGEGHTGYKNNVWVITGRLTADLRWNWGLDSVLRGHNEEISETQKKNRNDHRHHAIDAIVIACTDRSMLQRAARQAKKQEETFDDRLLAGIDPPWGKKGQFRTDVENSIRNIVVSHKPDHGIEGAMHNDTAYGIPKGKEGQPNKKGVRTVVTRKPLDSDSFKSPKDLEKIRDHEIKLKFLEVTQGLSGKDFKAALLMAANAMSPPVKRIRVEENLKVIPFKDRAGKEYKAYKGDGNYCYDIWTNEKDKWTGEVISSFEAYQLSRNDPKWWQKPVAPTGQKLVMRLRKNDYLQIEHDEKVLIVQINQVTPGTIIMSEHQEANVDARTRTKYEGDDPLKYIFKSPGSLQKAKAKRVTVSPSGMVKIYQ